MARRYLGYGITNSSGVAKLEYLYNSTTGQTSSSTSAHSYTGVGAGKIDVVAESGSLQSETYELWDTIWFDIATTGKKSNAWSNPDNVTITTTDDGTTLSDVANYYSSTTTMTGDFCIEFEMKTNGGQGRFGLYGSPLSKNVQKTIDDSTWKYYRIKRISGTFTLEVSEDGSAWTSTTINVNGLTTEDCSFKFYNLATTRTISYRNLKAYPI